MFIILLICKQLSATLTSPEEITSAVTTQFNRRILPILSTRDYLNISTEFHCYLENRRAGASFLTHHFPALFSFTLVRTLSSTVITKSHFTLLVIYKMTTTDIGVHLKQSTLMRMCSNCHVHTFTPQTCSCLSPKTCQAGCSVLYVTGQCDCGFVFQPSMNTPFDQSLEDQVLNQVCI